MLVFYLAIVNNVLHHSHLVGTTVVFVYSEFNINTVFFDSCVFVWRLPAEMTSQMQARLREMGRLPLHTTLTNGGLK